MADDMTTMTGTQNGAQDGAQNEQGGAGTPAAAKNTEMPGPVPYERFQEVNAALVELKRWKSEQEKAQTTAQKVAEEAETARLAEQQKWQELADKRATALKELEPVKVKAERYEAALTAILTTQRKGLPEHITALLDRLDPAEQLEWLATNQAALAKQAAPNLNAGGAPALQPGQDPKSREQELRARYRI